MKVIGVMSGSSLDGIDIVLTSFDGSSWELESCKTFPLTPKLKALLKTTVDQTARELAVTESSFSNHISDCLAEFMGIAQADLIGIHGHTILHLPEIETSWQLLNGGMVSSRLKLPVVCDFRNQDIALGGQGTPMAVIADRDLYPGHDYYINLGGIANISFKKEDRWSAYDLCPCNQLLNFYSQKEGQEFDKGGQLASTGKVHQTLLDSLLSESYILSPPPKSLDNSYIQSYILPKMEQLELSTPDYLRTIIEFIGAVICQEVRSKSGSLFLSGGGSKNNFLIETLRNKLANSDHEVVVPQANTLDYKEAILIAYCSYLRYQKQSNFISEATGATLDVSGGALYLPPSEVC